MFEDKNEVEGVLNSLQSILRMGVEKTEAVWTEILVESKLESHQE